MRIRDGKTTIFFGPARPVVPIPGPVRPVIQFLILGPFGPSKIYSVQTRGVNRTEISGPARPAINILQNLYNGLNFGFFLGGGELMKILISTGIICDLISEQSHTCWILKTKYYF